jgi:2-polyprenyl-3-methyl-5-hydroxy-6-metoxy-1,4-benzoquinol methylase
MTEIPLPPPFDHQAWLDGELRRQLTMVDEASRPNFSPLAMQLKNIELMALNIKYFGFELARRLAAEIPVRQNLKYAHVGLGCKPSTQVDLESAWCAYWCAELKIPVVFHRKVWEFVYLLQALAENGLLEPGRRGLGFGCGEEPLASYLAARGVHTMVTDLSSDEASAAGWQQTGQHLGALESAYMPNLVKREAFDACVTHRIVDMNAIPADLVAYDFCWSICALEHLGSIEQAMQFVRNAMATLKPGGVAIHTTEFNFLNDGETLDNWPTVLPQRRHFEALAESLRAEGHEVAPLDFNVGDKPLDRFIDIPPYPGDGGQKLERMGAHGDSNHLKLSIDGFASTCFGLIIRKGAAEVDA